MPNTRYQSVLVIGMCGVSTDLMDSPLNLIGFVKCILSRVLAPYLCKISPSSTFAIMCVFADVYSR